MVLVKTDTDRWLPCSRLSLRPLASFRFSLASPCSIAYDLTNTQGARGDQFMRMIEPLVSRQALVVSAGNHEYGGAAFASDPFLHYRERFAGLQFVANASGSTTTMRSYSVNIGLVHFIVFDTEYWSYGGTPEQIAVQQAWMEADLRQANASRAQQPWIVAVAHKAPFMDLTNLTMITPLLVKYNVDLAIVGHQHNYQRTRPILFAGGTRATVEDRCIADPGTMRIFRDCGLLTYLVVGSAGCREKLSTGGIGDYASAFQSINYGYGHLTVHNHTHLQWQWRLVANDSAIPFPKDQQIFQDEMWMIQTNNPAWRNPNPNPNPAPSLAPVPSIAPPAQTPAVTSSPSQPAPAPVPSSAATRTPSISPSATASYLPAAAANGLAFTGGVDPAVISSTVVVLLNASLNAVTDTLLQPEVLVASPAIICNILLPALARLLDWPQSGVALGAVARAVDGADGSLTGRTLTLFNYNDPDSCAASNIPFGPTLKLRRAAAAVERNLQIFPPSSSYYSTSNTVDSDVQTAINSASSSNSVFIGLKVYLLMSTPSSPPASADTIIALRVQEIIDLAQGLVNDLPSSFINDANSFIDFIAGAAGLPVPTPLPQPSSIPVPSSLPLPTPSVSGGSRRGLLAGAAAAVSGSSELLAGSAVAVTFQQSYQAAQDAAAAAKRKRVGSIVGGVLGGAAIAIGAAAFFVFYKRRQSSAAALRPRRLDGEVVTVVGAQGKSENSSLKLGSKSRSYQSYLPALSAASKRQDEEEGPHTALSPSSQRRHTTKKPFTADDTSSTDSEESDRGTNNTNGSGSGSGARRSFFASILNPLSRSVKAREDPAAARPRAGSALAAAASPTEAAEAKHK